MKQLAILILLALGVAAVACGHSNLPPTIYTNTSGNWEAQLIGGKGPVALLNFVTAFTVQNTNGGTSEPLTITGFSFFNTQSCFLSSSPTGSADLTTTSTNEVEGSMTYTITSQVQGTTLTLFTIDPTTQQEVGGLTGTAGSGGVLSNGVVTGEWTLSSTSSSSNSDCTGQGTFVMCQNAASCTAP